MKQSRTFVLLLTLIGAAALTQAQQHTPPTPTGPDGFNKSVDYNYDNFAYSPNIRKFIVRLPGVGPAGANELGNYIPVAGNEAGLFNDADFYNIGVAEYTRQLHPDLPATRLRGYYQLGDFATDPSKGGTPQYLGPLIVARSFDPTRAPYAGGNGAPVRIQFHNNLPSGAAGRLFLPVDRTLMGAGMGPTAGVNYADNRAVIHLHGGNTPWISDGTPHQWLVPTAEALNFPAGAAGNPYRKGVSFQNVPDMIGTGKLIPSPSLSDGLATYYWTNQQSQRLMFYHDHAYGITRLNVYAGMAAGYLLTDQAEDLMINAGVLPDYGIPLVIQDKTFVNDAATPPRDSAGNPTVLPSMTSYTQATDPLWNGLGGGNLWFPHEYMPNENIYDPSGALAWGRWDYGPWLNPPLVPINVTLPSPSHVPETFADTMLVNGAPYPYVNVDPKAYRFRILSAGNDRVLNLQFYVAADKNFPTTPGLSGTVLCNGVTAIGTDAGGNPIYPAATDCTEVKMVAASNPPPTPFCAPGAAVNPNTGLPVGCTPQTWPVDGRYSGVPDPVTAGPQFIQIGNEGGILPQVVTVPAQPIDFEYSRRVPVVLNVKSQGLLLMPAERADVIVDFSTFAGQTLILYNDAPAPMPLYDDRNDLYTGSPDWTAIGGAPSTPAGYGPNTRTVMQIRVAATCSAACSPANISGLQQALPAAYAATQAPPIVPQSAYNTAFNTHNADYFVQNVDATVNLAGAAGVSRVVVTVPGSGYLVPPTVQFQSMNGPGSGASATACLNGVTAVTVTLAGAGYTTAPTVQFNSVKGNKGAGATGVASVSGGGVSAVTIVNPGCNYTANPNVVISAPACAINGTTCVQAAATANVTLGAVASITMTAAGSGYTKAPFVFLNPAPGDPGRGATADAMITGDTVIGMKNITEGFEPWYGRMNVQLGTTPVPLDTTTPAPQVPGVAMYIDPPSDFFNDGQPQVFRITHLGVDSHIVHFHLANLQVINRVDFTNSLYPPMPNELGWKESIRTNPFTDLVVAVRPVSQWLPFQIPQSNRLMDPTTVAGSTANYVQPAPVPGLPTPAGISNVMTNYGWEYVWHCHLLGHEENDMMRPIVFNVPVPPTPTGLTASNVGGHAYLNWSGGGNTRTFTIQRSTSSTFPAASTVTLPALIGFPPANSFTDNTVGSFYRVQATNGAGVSGWSNTASTAAANTITIATPTNLTATLLAGPGIGLNWKDNANNETGYQVQRIGPDGTVVTVLPANSNNYTDKTVLVGNSYTYTVAAINAAANSTSPWSNQTVISTSAPQAPFNVVAKATTKNSNNDTVTVTWSINPTNQSGFNIRYSTDPTFATGTTTASVAGNVLSLTTGNLPRGVTIYFQVQSTNVVGASAWTPATPIGVLTP